MKKKKLIQIITVMLLALVSSLLMYRFLPAGLEQRGNGTMPKFVYVTVTFLLSAGFSMLYYFREDKKFLYVAGLGIIIPIFAYFFGNIF